jgi:hypothetical protein
MGELVAPPLGSQAGIKIGSSANHQKTDAFAGVRFFWA